ncbi:MAG: tetratricopeptide repeat protein [Proteobacteria bacterium]|nr:tetratricopeptide repeat protein [Pseudomonadota bacterium]
MKRFCASLAVSLAMLALPAAAQVTGVDPSQTPVAPAEKAKSPAQLRAAELDRLFGQLHAQNAEASAATIESKIWANWSRSDSATAELLLGQAGKAMAADEYDAAQSILDQIVKSYPDFAEGWNRRATLYFKMRRYQQSLSDIERVLELEPRHFGALTGRGMILMQMGKPDEALAAYREALSMNPYLQGVADTVKQIEKERPDI